MEQDAARKKSTRPCPGSFLEETPDAWLDQMVRSLPGRSKLALFRSSKQLGRVVVRSARRVKLRLAAADRNARWYHCTNEPVVRKRRHIIEALLQGCHDLELVINTQELQPCPNGFNSVITGLFEEQDKQQYLSQGSARAGSDMANFTNMTNLQVISLGEGTSVYAIKKLCAALESEQLPQLHTLGFMCMGKDNWQLGSEEKEAIQRLAEAVGPQIKHLKTSCTLLLCQLPKFTELQSVAVYDAADLWEKEETVQYLCEHPSVRMVTFGRSTSGSLGINKQYKQLTCHWETLVMHNVHSDVLACLPLTSLKELRFVNQLPEARGKEANLGLLAVLGHPTLKVVCQPDPMLGNGVFHLPGWSEQHASLLARIDGAHTLHLSHAFRCPSYLPEVWAALPACITHIIWNPGYGGAKYWEAMWQGLPQHVTLLTLQLPADTTEKDIQQFVKSVPEHIRLLRLQATGYPAYVFRGAFCNELYLAAPAHVQLVIKPWGRPHQKHR